uniref:SAC3/GANP/THP3 conserved domain-containing protein n=1 Tax=Chromera velia CCMP2878 TaxID=1169474 RepID=A0A0G4HJU1_9ALVE|eukprot:Cvel_1114.t1-p1 / transcript=Cvel_1114.t1 / gene=Cvel_1114 / organism=Chromera_velia_CCMP2878 / gene_product=THP3 homolog C2A9.11c, putative / transcript_product=THP3 homolog C2A9.11c, putative / location=Cvel_scaffold36:135507-141464(-) / protein_length=780 / sequence_SO=supercontig / SO=protein_coding / is_pseudo=false
MNTNANQNGALFQGWDPNDEIGSLNRYKAWLRSQGTYTEDQIETHAKSALQWQRNQAAQQQQQQQQQQRIQQQQLMYQQMQYQQMQAASAWAQQTQHLFGNPQLNPLGVHFDPNTQTEFFRNKLVPGLLKWQEGFLTCQDNQANSLKVEYIRKMGELLGQLPQKYIGVDFTSAAFPDAVLIMVPMSSFTQLPPGHVMLTQQELLRREQAKQQRQMEEYQRANQQGSMNTSAIGGGGSETTVASAPSVPEPPNQGLGAVAAAAAKAHRLRQQQQQQQAQSHPSGQPGLNGTAGTGVGLPAEALSGALADIQDLQRRQRDGNLPSSSQAASSSRGQSSFGSSNQFASRNAVAGQGRRSFDAWGGSSAGPSREMSRGSSGGFGQPVGGRERFRRSRDRDGDVNMSSDGSDMTGPEHGRSRSRSRSREAERGGDFWAQTASLRMVEGLGAGGKGGLAGLRASVGLSLQTKKEKKSGGAILKPRQSPASTTTHHSEFNAFRTQANFIGTSDQLEKEYLRLTDAPREEEVRPEPVLREALPHVIRKAGMERKSWKWLGDQMRAIRQDMKVQRIENDLTVKVYENNADLAIENGDLGQFNVCVTQLGHLYRLSSVPSDAKTRKNEYHAIRYVYLIVNGLKDAIMKEMGQMSTEEKVDQGMVWAEKFRKALQLQNWVKVFTLFTTAPYRIPALLQLYRDKLRMNAIRVLVKSSNRWPVKWISDNLGFQSERDAFQFLCDHQAVFVDRSAAVLQSGLPEWEGRHIDSKKSLPVLKSCKLLSSNKVHALG